MYAAQPNGADSATINPAALNTGTSLAAPLPPFFFCCFIARPARWGMLGLWWWWRVGGGCCLVCGGGGGGGLRHANRSNAQARDGCSSRSPAAAFQSTTIATRDAPRRRAHSWSRRVAVSWPRCPHLDASFFVFVFPSSRVAPRNPQHANRHHQKHHHPSILPTQCPHARSPRPLRYLARSSLDG